MTEKQKKAFLKAEGWPKDPHTDGRFIDPRTAGKDGREVSYSLAFGYVTASRRKRQREAARRQREAARLRRAGWTYGDFQCFNYEPHAFGWWHPKHPSPHTRQEALQTLERQP